MQLHQEGRTVSEYIVKFEELCKFSTIYQRNPDEAWKYVKFEGELREDILATMGPMKIRDFPTLVNKCRLVEEYNWKLKTAKSDAYRKRLASEDQNSEHAPLPKKPFQPNGNESKQLQGPPMKQECSKCGKYHGGRPCLAGQNVCFKGGKLRHRIKECPGYQPPTPKPQHQGKVFTLSTEGTTPVKEKGQD